MDKCQSPPIRSVGSALWQRTATWTPAVAEDEQDGQHHRVGR
jgi:hypothetical protein